MKYKYLILLLVTISSIGKINSQACPEVSSVLGLPTEEIVFLFNDPGPDCSSRPAAIVIDGSAYVLGNCDTFSSRYVLSSGSGVIDPDNYTVTYGSSNCEYINGTLGEDDMFLINRKTIKLFPNPLRGNNELNISFAIPISATVAVYDLNGKMVLNDKMNNERSKKINVFDLSNGIYLIKVQTETSAITKKIVISN